ncbi:MAG: tRNA pseudouridine(55) synthase TruB [Armatimonadota bacterium]
MDGVLNVCKPPGMTSHDVVTHVRRTAGIKRVGHTGTLDPMAAGVLVLCLGRGTRAAEYLVHADKSYVAELTLGVSTDTLDAEGDIVAEADASGVTEKAMREGLAGLVGEREQRPPMFSAAKRQGRKLYELARQGQTVERAPRRVSIHGVSLLRMEPGKRAKALFEVTCSKGTYVRSLCAELGEALGCGGHLSFLVRTRAGRHRLEQARTIEELPDRAAIESGLEPLSAALAHLPLIEVSARQRRMLANGRPVWVSRQVEAEPADGALARGCDSDGELVCVGEYTREAQRGVLRPKKVFVN